MKKRIAAIFISSLLIANGTFASDYFVDSSEFTGESFFTPPVFQNEQGEVKQEDSSSHHGTIPPIKKIRLLTKKKLKNNHDKKYQLAPTASMDDIYAAGAETSKYASQDIEEDFDENMMPDGFEADEISTEEIKKTKGFWSKKNKKEDQIVDKDTESIVLDCENVDYDTNNYTIKATGNVSVLFVEQDTTLKADVITYDRISNTIKTRRN